MITTRAGLFYSNFYFLNLLQPLRGFQAESLPVVHKDTGGVTAAVIQALVIQKIKEKLDLDVSVYPELYQTEALITEIKKSIYGSCTLNVAGEFFFFSHSMHWKLVWSLLCYYSASSCQNHCAAFFLSLHPSALECTARTVVVPPKKCE